MPGLLAAAMFLALASAPMQESERWRGVIDLTGFGQGELEFFVTFASGGDDVTATISIPAQGATDLPLTDVVYSESRLEFTLVTSPNNARFGADRDGDTANGILDQGAEIPIRMELLGADEAAGPSRPQHPQPPFPYSAREVSYTNPAEGNTLAGTLTVPAGEGPHPAAILITGSGSQDRDETIFAHKPFWVIADHLSRSGVAVLRVDDRGVGGSDGARADMTSLDFAGDVEAGVAYLGEQPEIADDRIGLIGHSEGGLIAPIVAGRDPSVAFIVMLAGQGISGRELMPLQYAAIQRAAGRSEEDLVRHLEVYDALMDAVVHGSGPEVIRAHTEALVDLDLQALPEEQRQGPGRDRAVEQGVAQVSSAWWRTFMITDPADTLTAVHCPVLALNGTLDLQVPAEANLPAIESTLRGAGNDDVTVVALEGLNHLFQSAGTGLVSEYGQIEETFAPAALEIMTAWIRTRTGLD